MNISVPPGTAAVPLQAGQGTALCVWDAAEVVTLAAATHPAGQTRIDLVVAQVRDNAIDGGANNDFVFASVTGVPAASNPAVPAVPTNAYAVCQVLVPGAVANLNTATVTDMRRTLALQRSTARVYLAVTQAGVATGFTKVAFDTVDYNPDGLWIPASKRYVVQSAGVYSLKAQLAFYVINNPQNSQVCLYRNGVRTRNGAGYFIRGATGGDVWNLPFAEDINCAAGDYLEIFAYNGGATAAQIVASAGQDSYFSIVGPQ
jgi:hypothetical protein